MTGSPAQDPTSQRGKRSGLRAVQIAVGQWLDAHLTAPRPVTVACSGGADSLALAAAVITEAPRQGHPARAVTVDHGLQPGSVDQAARTARQLRDLGYTDVESVRVQVGTAGGPEAAARTARYAALHPRAQGGAVLLAHTLDDQAETVLLGLARGSGARSLAGMRPWAAPYGRPLLGLRRDTTEQACRDAGVEPWTDPHNADTRFTRVRLRSEALPLLEDILGGGVAAALARTADQLAQDNAALDHLAVAVLTSAVGPQGLERDPVADQPAAVRLRVLRLWLTATGIAGLTAEHLRRVDQLLTGGSTSAGVRVPGGRDVALDVRSLAGGGTGGRLSVRSTGSVAR